MSKLTVRIVVAVERVDPELATLLEQLCMWKEGAKHAIRHDWSDAALTRWLQYGVNLGHSIETRLYDIPEPREVRASGVEKQP